MDNETFTTLQPTSLSGSEPLVNQRQLEYATQRAKVLFGAYRRGDANNPDQYVASIAAVLTLYEPEIVREVTDPRGGISTDPKHITFMPNSGELKVYCDTVRDRRWRQAQWNGHKAQALPPPVRKPPEPGKSYVEMFEKHGRPTGPFEKVGDKWNRR
jgi:hypothetical protein